MIIDCHTHIGGFIDGKTEVINPTVEDLLRAMDESGVQMSLVISNSLTDLDEGLTPDEAVREIRKFPERLRVIAHIDLSHLDEEGYIENLAELLEQKEVVGLKVYLGYQKCDLSDERLTPLFKACEQLNMPVMVHTGLLLVGVVGSGQEAHPREVGKAAEKYPNNIFIAAHFGNPWIEECAEVMAKYKNVYADLSGYFIEYEAITEKGKQELWNDMKIFKDACVGADRLLFGTDWPIYSQKEYVEVVKSLPFSPEELENILWKNAKKVFGL